MSGDTDIVFSINFNSLAHIEINIQPMPPKVRNTMLEGNNVVKSKLERMWLTPGSPSSERSFFSLSCSIYAGWPRIHDLKRGVKKPVNSEVVRLTECHFLVPQPHSFYRTSSEFCCTPLLPITCCPYTYREFHRLRQGLR